jgi:hypothetical protein
MHLQAVAARLSFNGHAAHESTQVMEAGAPAAALPILRLTSCVPSHTSGAVGMSKGVAGSAAAALGLDPGLLLTGLEPLAEALPTGGGGGGSSSCWLLQLSPTPFSTHLATAIGLARCLLSTPSNTKPRW